MIDGAAAHAGALTVSVTALVVVDPNALVNVASYFVPLCAVVVVGVVYDPDVAPEIGENEPAPGACEDHCTLGAEQFAGVERPPRTTPTPAPSPSGADGCVVIDGAAAHAGAFTV